MGEEGGSAKIVVPEAAM